MVLAVMRVLAVLLTALALVPGGAHLFELPNKIDLPLEAYFTVQGIYRGWAKFGVVLIGAILANLCHAWLLRRRPAACGLALAAGLLVLATLAIFFTWTYPANQATANWTTIPADWDRLRTQWEYSHAANAVLTFLALAAATLAAVAGAKPPPGR
jgi:hypothetical protein